MKTIREAIEQNPWIDECKDVTEHSAIVVHAGGKSFLFYISENKVRQVEFTASRFEIAKETALKDGWNGQ